jgi:putative PIN family toxin of toxin-antitoxin system
VRVVLDTNVLLAGLITRGVCELVLDACWDPSSSLTVICSEHILAEFAEHAVSKFHVPDEEVSDAVASLRRRVEVVEPSDVPADACRDADDLPILGTAAAGKAECLVTGDRDLLALKSFQGILIMAPREFYDRLRSSG